MLTARRQKKLKVQGSNENFLKRITLDVPDELSDRLPNAGVRLAVRHSTGFYQGITPVMVSIYLVPRNGSRRERELVETVILSHDGPVCFDGESRSFAGGYERQLGALAQKWKQHPPAEEVANAIAGYKLKEILTDYVARTQATAQSE